MAALRSAGLADDTVVVLTSDHGEMLGERGLWYKMSFFEGASRVPLVIGAVRARFAPRRVGSSVSLIDLMPTLVDISGGSADRSGSPSMDGALRPISAASRRSTKPLASISRKVRLRRS